MPIASLESARRGVAARLVGSRVGVRRRLALVATAALVGTFAFEAPSYAQAQRPVSITPAPQKILPAPKQPISAASKHALLQKLRANHIPLEKADEFNILSPTPTTSKQSLADALQQRQILRRLTPADLSSGASLQLGSTTVDLAPVMKSPHSLTNVAKSIRAMPNLASVDKDNIEVLQLDNGVLVQQYISYKVKPGACDNASNRSRLTAAGVDCLKRAPLSGRVAELSNPSSPRYVADASKRATAVAEMTRADAQATADLRQGHQTFHANLKDSAKRAELERALGKSEVNRIAALSEDAYIQEVIQNAVTEIESVVFVPAQPVKSGLKKSPQLQSIGTLTTAPKLEPLGPARPIMPTPAPRQEAPTVYETFRSRASIGDHVFLTGFTHEYSYSWQKHVSKTINTCFFGCQKRYGATAIATFSYAAGLRVPIEVQSEYIYEIDAQGKVSSSVSMKAAPVNGSREQYLSSGLPASKLYDAKEIVLEAGVWAYAAARLPIMGHKSIKYEESYDFTRHLPSPFRDGQFTPPSPGHTTDRAPFAVNLDLLGGLANFGVAGASIRPLFGLSLSSSRLELGFVDQQGGGRRQVSFTGQPVTFPVGHSNATYTSRFGIGYPTYDVRLNIEPGVRAKLWVDVAVWSSEWTWDVYIPELKVSLPPQGTDFSCHQGTTCTRMFQVPPPSRPTPVTAPR